MEYCRVEGNTIIIDNNFIMKEIGIMENNMVRGFTVTKTKLDYKRKCYKKN